MHYFNVVLCLFEPFVTTSQSDKENDEDKVEGESPEQVLLNTKIRLETVWRLYYLRHGFDSYDPFMLQVLIVLGFMSCKALSGSGLLLQQAELFRSTMVLAGKGMYCHAKNCFLAETTFRLFRHTLGAENARLLKDYGDIIDEDSQEKKEAIANQVRSQFPINIVNIAESPENYRVDNLIAAFQEAGLWDDTEEEVLN
ncbi:hypothetical protein VFPPC_17912 [Pochonia chlamydosporia 170]|uniref:Uncharacterized protein n=1 Tax=Pochonia chlamydosporia 170 TaxID=1380566 RepID=A0A219ARQ9_METCM|nr:hypothetical protein VFPPC_17912 [Pochonia chlamydosporia 170]OWT42895.1 hypothetical protein VFPPC_17912 [Pochonia chlamydosporia 170]